MRSRRTRRGCGVERHSNPHHPPSCAAIIRGISDRADGTKNSADDRSWQPRAAANAAAFATRLAVELVGEQEETAVPRDDRVHSADRLDRHVSNTAHNSTVGIMAGSVTGSSVHMNAAPKASGPTDLISELNGFREHLGRHHAEGALDEDTYREALTDLDSALRSAGRNTPDSSKRTAMTLRRLRGLVAECPALVAELAAMIAAAGDLA